jgi:hypothetical protein
MLHLGLKLPTAVGFWARPFDLQDYSALLQGIATACQGKSSPVSMTSFFDVPSPKQRFL